ncbi:MAG: small conductance mechanosensitive channel [Rhodothermales bacterium]|jgi:small conductance mechanosensitive channel
MIQDSTQAVPSALPADSTDALSDLGRGVEETGRLLAQGDVGDAASIVVDGARGMVETFLPSLLSAIFVFLFFYAVYRLISKILDASMSHSARVDHGLQHLTMRTFRLVAWTFIIVMVLAQFGVDVTALLAGLSIVGIAVSFAAKDTLENFIAGVTIMLDRPFSVGDYIVVDDTYGCIQTITLRSTRLLMQNEEIMVMPNLAMINQKLVNHSISPGLRVEINFGIAYREFPEDARSVVLALFEDDKRLDPNRAPFLVVTEMGSSSVDLSARFFIKDPGMQIPMRTEYTEKILEALRGAGIEIPFPHLQVHIDGAKGLRGLPQLTSS